MHITVTSTKGGSGKTTTAMYLAAALAERGSTLVIDCDGQGSALSWANKADLPFDVIVTAKVDRDVDRHAKNYEFIVVDTAPGDMKGIVNAIRAADHVILPSQPTPADLDKILEVDELVNDERDDETDLPTLHVLLTRVVKRTVAQFEAREIIENNGIPIFDAEIYNRQGIALAHGDVIGTEFYEYADVLDELTRIHKELD